jgi:uncharacterized tellurite resistance protein B-like protein
MLNFFKTEKASKENNISVISVACLLIHAARIDENYSNKEKEIIKKTLFKLGTNDNNIDDIIEKAEDAEKNSNQILKFTKEAKNLEKEKKNNTFRCLGGHNLFRQECRHIGNKSNAKNIWFALLRQ